MIKKLHTGNSEFNFKAVAGIILLAGISLFATTGFSQTAETEVNCVDCHSDIIDKNHIHGPVGGDCTICHESNGQEHPNDSGKNFTLFAEGSELCYSCHIEEHAANNTNKNVHPAMDGGSCLDCHEVHSSNEPKFISSKVPDLCNMCHYEIEQAITELAVVHSPAKEDGGCVSCHSAHSSMERNILKSNEKTLCLSCHSNTINLVDREIADIGKVIKESKVLHAAIEDGCVTCHSPHASANARLLTSSYPVGNYAVGTEDNYELCFTCHDSYLLTQKTTTDATNFRDGEVNLHFLHVNKEKGRTCNNCHDIHGSTGDHLVPETVKFGGWNMPLQYIANENGGSCATGCHKELKYTR